MSHHYLLSPLFGLPPITIPEPSAKPQVQLHQRNILWTSVKFVSLVSKVPADFITSKRPSLKYCFQEESISLTAAGPKSNLKAVATVEIPITWENTSETIFTMLVVLGLV